MSSPYLDDTNGIPPGSFILRRISAQWVDWETLNDRGQPRVTKEAVQFYDQQRAEQAGCPGPALSVVVEHLAASPADLAEKYAGFGLARLSVDLVRENGVCGVQLWPTDDESAHAVIFRVDGGNRPSDGTRKRWAQALTDGWLCLPPRAG